MNRILTKYFAILLVGLSINSFASLASATQITSVRHWVGPNNTRLVFDTNNPIDHSMFKLSSPDRIVVDLKNTSLAKPFPLLNIDNSLIRSIRNAKRGASDLRIVLDLQGKATAQSFVLKPNEHYGYRLVLDIRSADSPVTKKIKRKIIKHIPNHNRSVVIAIDAGHGGEDPGAIGQLGTKEKSVVLGISNALYRLLKNEPGMTPLMVRRGDYYVSLRERMELAREDQADLFISIHADAVENGDARGASVYVLSQKGASSEAARWLATSQNNADLIGGVSLDNKDDMLASVLLDLTQNATLEASTLLGQMVIDKLGELGEVHKHSVEKAGFVVLKSPDIPSILVETGFISNRVEERLLGNRRHQRSVAKAVLAGVRAYFAKNAMPGTVFARAGRVHRIEQGETLSLLARRYSVSLLKLKALNHLANDHINIGQIIKIPSINGS